MYEDIEFAVKSETLRGRLYTPDAGNGPYPLVIAHSGIGSAAEAFFELGPRFAELGLAALFYDHRNYGNSTGEPRQQSDPWQFARDLREVITQVEVRDDIDAKRIALLGLSLGGMVDIIAAANDPRVAALVTMVPPISGWKSRQLFPAEAIDHLDAAILADRRGQAKGEKPAIMRLSGKDIEGAPPAMFNDDEGITFVKTFDKYPTFHNEITLQSVELLFEAEVAIYAKRLTMPTFMILASDDTIAPVDDARAFFEEIPGEKEIVEYPGQHYAILNGYYDEIMERAARWIKDHLPA